VSKGQVDPLIKSLKTFQRNLSRQHRDRLHYHHLQGTEILPSKIRLKNANDIDLKNLKVGRLGQI
jgi:hypothetical protein